MAKGMQGVGTVSEFVDPGLVADHPVRMPPSTEKMPILRRASTWATALRIARSAPALAQRRLRYFNTDRLTADSLLNVHSHKIVPAKASKAERVGTAMSDLLMLSLAIASFAAAIAYALICERL
jgi:hypothetical protein